MAKYRKKPIVVDAIKYDGTSRNFIEITKFISEDEKRKNVSLNQDQSITIVTLEGDMRASVGDWIIRGIAGEYYPCKPEIFEVSYVLV